MKHKNTHVNAHIQFKIICIFIVEICAINKRQSLLRFELACLYNNRYNLFIVSYFEYLVNKYYCTGSWFLHDINEHRITNRRFDYRTIHEYTRGSY